jgi:hypothetical protein
MFFHTNVLSVFWHLITLDHDDSNMFLKKRITMKVWREHRFQWETLHNVANITEDNFPISQKSVSHLVRAVEAGRQKLSIRSLLKALE